LGKYYRGEQEVRRRYLLRCMSGVTREDRIRNEYVRGRVDSIGVASIVDKMRDSLSM